jgi:hypothetical protein
MSGKRFGAVVINGMAESVQMVAESAFAALMAKVQGAAGADLVGRIGLIGAGIDGQAMQVKMASPTTG